MAETLTIRTATSTDVVKVIERGPQGPAGPAGTGLETLTTQGDLLYRGATVGERLPIGTSGQVLKVSNGLPAWANESGAVASVNDQTGSVYLDGSEINTSASDDRMAFVASGFDDDGATGLYYPLDDLTINSKRIYKSTNGYHAFFENSRWHLTDGTPVTENIVASSNNNNAAWPWKTTWPGTVTEATVADVVGRARSTFLFQGDLFPKTMISGLGTAAEEDVGAFATASHSHELDALDATGGGAGDLLVADGAGGVSWESFISPSAITGTAVVDSDARLSDSRTPTAHAASHASAGSDPLFDQDLNTTDNVTFVDVYVGSLTADGSSQNPPTADSCSVTPQGFEFIGTAAATTRTNLGLGDAATADIGTGSTEVAAGDHSHGNLTNDGKLGSTAGLPVVTTTAGAITTLALGTANQVLRVNSGASGVEFADPAASGVTGAAASASDVLGVSGANITGVDANADRIVFWDDSASALKYLEVSSGLSLSGTTLTATASGGSKTYAVFTATDNQPPATAFATYDTRSSIAVLDFDDATTESAVFAGIMPEGASLGSGLIVRIHFMGTTATSGDVRWSVAFERGNTDLDSDSFDTATAATVSTSSTAGIPAVAAITCTNIDGITAGDMFRLRVQRIGGDGADTASGDMELVVCEVRSAA